MHCWTTLTYVQDCRGYSRFLLLHPSGNIPRLARGDRRLWFRARSQALPVPTRLPGRPGTHLRVIRVRPRFGTMATYRICRRQYDSPRHGQRKCQEWRWFLSHGAWLVWLRATSHCHSRFAGDDLEYQSDPQTDRWGMIEFFQPTQLNAHATKCCSLFITVFLRLALCLCLFTRNIHHPYNGTTQMGNE